MEHVDELIPGHAMRSLDPEDETGRSTHLADCDRCRRMLADSRRRASLAYAAPGVRRRRRSCANACWRSLEPVVEAPPAVATEPRSDAVRLVAARRRGGRARPSRPA